MRFVSAVTKVLQEPPTADFRVPIVVEPKIGRRFGELRELERWEYTANWIVRAWHRISRYVRLYVTRLSGFKLALARTYARYLYMYWKHQSPSQSGSALGSIGEDANVERMS
jgi:hypothetical protein